MKWKPLIIFLLFISLTGLNAYSQRNTSGDRVPYSVDYVFKDGVYFSHKDLLNNDPVSFVSFVSPNIEDKDFFDNLINQKTIRYFDDYGNVAEVRSNNIWGYSKNGRPHILWKGKFNLIPYLSTVSHFVATVMVRYEDFGGGPMHSPYYGGRRVYYREEVVQYFFDFESGNVLNYDANSVRYVLRRDPELKETFNNLRRREKNKMLFYYIKQYNERNPLYLPKN